MINAFSKISDYRVSGLAVVNSEGRLVGNVSASDLRLARFDDPVEFLKNLQTPIKCFLSYKSNNSAIFGGEEGRSPLEPVSIKSQDTLQTAIEKICKNNIHRIYTVDENFKPTQVVTLSDIIEVFAPWAW